jgi:hypothetical protein
MARNGSSGNSAKPRDEPTPWFRRRWVLITWSALVVLMIALVIWGIIQLISLGSDGSTVPSTQSSTTRSSTTTISPTTTKGAATIPPARPPREAPAPGGPPNEPPHHRPHLPPLPSVITIPPLPNVPEAPTVITLPPGF